METPNPKSDFYMSSSRIIITEPLFVVPGISRHFKADSVTLLCECKIDHETHRSRDIAAKKDTQKQRQGDTERHTEAETKRHRKTHRSRDKETQKDTQRKVD